MGIETLIVVKHSSKPRFDRKLEVIGQLLGGLVLEASGLVKH